MEYKWNYDNSLNMKYILGMPTLRVHIMRSYKIRLVIEIWRFCYIYNNNDDVNNLLPEKLQNYISYWNLKILIHVIIMMMLIIFPFWFSNECPSCFEFYVLSLPVQKFNEFISVDKAVINYFFGRGIPDYTKIQASPAEDKSHIHTPPDKYVYSILLVINNHHDYNRTNDSADSSYSENYS